VFEANCVRLQSRAITVNPHLFTQGSKAGERSSPLRWFPHQPQTRFRCKACRNLAQAGGSRLFFYQANSGGAFAELHAASKETKGSAQIFFAYSAFFLHQNPCAS
jgi:hypothetical protein